MINQYSGFGMSIFIFVLYNLIGTLEDTRGIWLIFGFLFLIWILLNIVITNASNLVLSLFWRCKNIYVLYSPVLVFVGHWVFPDLGWHFDFHLDMVSAFWYTNGPNFGCLSRFGRFKICMSPQVLIGTLENARGSWLGCPLNFDFDMVTGLWNTNFPHFLPAWIDCVSVPEILIWVLEDVGQVLTSVSHFYSYLNVIASVQ